MVSWPSSKARPSSLFSSVEEKLLILILLKGSCMVSCTRGFSPKQNSVFVCTQVARLAGLLIAIASLNIRCHVNIFGSQFLSQAVTCSRQAERLYSHFL